MSRLEFNIRFCMFNLVIIVSIIALIFILIAKTTKNMKIYKVIVIAFGAFVAIVFSVSLFFGFAECDCVYHNVIVDNVVYMSGKGDVFSYYIVYANAEDGSEIQFSSIIFSSKKLNNKLSNLRAGDKIDIYYEPDLSYLIDMVFCE